VSGAAGQVAAGSRRAADVDTWHESTDVVVVGTGAAGLTAALAARVAGAEVVVLEKSAFVGGTTAVSGGVIWVPCNPQMRAAGLEDSREEAIGYMLRCADGRGTRAESERYIDASLDMIGFVESASDVRFASLVDYPDYHPEFPGGKKGGRPLDNGLFDTTLLGEWSAKLRRNPVNGRSPMTIAEAMGWGVFSNPMGFDYKLVAERAKKGIVHGGTALVGKLLKACLARGVAPRVESPGKQLVVDERCAVLGLVVQGPDGAERTLRARKGVILASGGFEWDASLRKDFLVPELEHPLSPPSCDGDGLRMAMALGARLGNMSEAWWTPAIAVPGETREGHPLYRGEFSVRCLPHSIIVNRAGKRFTTESHNYNDMTKPFFHHDPFAYDRVNVPAWLIVDQAYVDKYMLVTAAPGRPVPEWIAQAPTLDALATKLGISAPGLAETVARFNRFAVEGHDPDFHRGESAFDRYYGDPAHGPNPNLGTIAKAPFYAVAIHPGAMGTKGGPKVDLDGRVQHVNGAAIPGLYAAGNVMSAIAGHGYAGPGITICTAMTWGMLAARHAAARSVEA
jgi:succinate dehydrogenase/fumarate reductase flavoprotein subunit